MTDPETPDSEATSATVSKRDRFIRLAESRTNKILNTIRLLKNCSNRNNYDYTEEDVEKIFSVIEQALDEARQSFQTVLEKSGNSFRLE